jgi:hypothetical protein
MRLPLAFAAAFVLALPAGEVAAAVDCEPARCAFQQAIDDQCRCDEATNHGRHVSCVAHVVKDLARQGVIPTNCKGKIKRCAARSTCGKPGFVTCQIPTDTCDLATSTCTANPTVACATDLECGARCKTKSSAEHCVAVGGTPGPAGSCCAACPTGP